MATFKITIAYDGTGFVGWQRQARGTSIQGLVEDAVSALDGRRVIVHGAGRTDAGVHALGQVASFALVRDVDADTVMRAANARLPPAVRIVDAETADAAFHARHRARAKRYAYRILNRRLCDVFERAYVWHVPGALDTGAMDAAARQLEGRHDFAAFQASGSAAKTTEREIRCIKLSTTEDTEDTGNTGERRRGQVSLHIAETRRHDALRVPRVLRGGEFLSVGSGGGSRRLITIEIAGSGFLRHMIRIIVGSLVEIGRGRRDAAWLGRALASGDRRLAGPTAPARGLFLLGVDYPSDVLADEC
jgi:tRNA pseudouridine38-40 synthase